MIKELQAVNTYVLVIRDEVEEEINGLYLPDQAKVKPARGEIISVGESVTDKSIQVGKKALWNKNTGFEIDFPDGTVTVLNGGDRDSNIIAVL